MKIVYMLHSSANKIILMHTLWSCSVLHTVLTVESLFMYSKNPLAIDVHFIHHIIDANIKTMPKVNNLLPIRSKSSHVKHVSLCFDTTLHSSTHGPFNTIGITIIKANPTTRPNKAHVLFKVYVNLSQRAYDMIEDQV